MACTLKKVRKLDTVTGYKRGAVPNPPFVLPISLPALLIRTQPLLDETILSKITAFNRL